MFKLVSVPWCQVHQLWGKNLCAASALKGQHRFLERWKCQILGFGAWVFWLASARRVLWVHVFQWAEVWTLAQGVSSIPVFICIWIQQDRSSFSLCVSARQWTGWVFLEVLRGDRTSRVHRETKTVLTLSSVSLLQPEVCYQLVCFISTLPNFINALPDFVMLWVMRVIRRRRRKEHVCRCEWGGGILCTWHWLSAYTCTSYLQRKRLREWSKEIQRKYSL